MNFFVLVFIASYGFGVWKFARGFARTQYENSTGNRLRLALLWPLLLLLSKSYRTNFQRALKGR
ncbi:hypothetical protein KR51_00032570 [Rubidibacter lacunae KORDI 51-2]|uniref:Uncharacterized protein n=1 Tax=Rubidibacter lacunae KORDI 51-2 TaxID=582515 RepID=U5DFD2_9CHRO|nr:hypothetical protein [Rubidibacter lacunae]ERN40311.1 hypothetical protein KR51_00032570 [Rubidibacter lacunae KORDI 51-2]